MSFTVTQVIEGSTREVLVREMKIHFLMEQMSGSCILSAIYDIF